MKDVVISNYTKECSKILKEENTEYLQFQVLLEKYLSQFKYEGAYKHY